MYVPSRRRYSLRVRTITAFTTLPFFTVPSGEASFTAAVTTSPRPAFLPRPPPSGRITWSLRAPELSATSRMVRICTAIANLLHARGQNRQRKNFQLCKPTQISGPENQLRSRLLVHVRERRTADDLFQRPALQLRQRTRLAN